MERTACGSREQVNCEHMQVFFFDEYAAAALGMAGGSSGRLDARVLQVQNGFHGKVGCEDGVRRGQVQPGSLWWTSTHREEDETTLRVWEQRENLGPALHGRCSMFWGYRFRRDGKVNQVTEKTHR